MSEWILTSSVLITVIVLLRRGLKGKISARLQYGLWLLVAIRLLIPVSLFDSSFSVANVADQMKEQAVETPITKPVTNLVIQIGNIEVPKMDYDSAYQQVLDRYEEQGVVISGLNPSELEQLEHEAYEVMQGSTVKALLTQGLYVIWLAGMVTTVGVILVSNLRFGAKLRRSRRCCGAIGPNGLTENTGFLKVYMTELVDTPCLFGVFRPVVYVTPEVWSDKKVLQYALEHEMTHYRHGDHVWALVRCVSLMLHWYNPLVWLAVPLSRRDGELACDEGTLKRIGEASRTDYGRTILELACGRMEMKTMFTTATTMVGDKKSLKERIERIANAPKKAVWAAVAVLLVAVLAVGSTYSGGMQRPKAETVPPVTSGSEETIPGGSDDNADLNGEKENTGNGYTGGETWMQLAWESFKLPAEWTEDTNLKWYTGFVDGVENRDEVDRFPALDYDGDGLTDRIYQRNSYGITYYLFCGNGEVLELGFDSLRSGRGETHSLDVTGDGKNELMFILWTGGSLYLGIWEATEQGWQQMDLPFAVLTDSYVKGVNRLKLPVRLKLLDETTVQVTQPQTGLTDIQMLEAGESDKWKCEWSAAEAEGSLALIKGETLMLVPDEESGKYILRFMGELEEAQSSLYVDWEMEYVDGQWQIRNFLVDPFREIIENHKDWLLDTEKTDQGALENSAFQMMFKNKAPIKWTVFISVNGVFYGGMYLPDGQVMVNRQCGWSDLPNVGEEFAVTVHLYEYVIPEGASDQMELKLVTEGGERYLVLEYEGDKLYFKTITGDNSHCVVVDY